MTNHWPARPDWAAVVAVLACVCTILGFAPAASARPLAIRLPDRFTSPPSARECVKVFGATCYRPAQLQQAYDLRPLYRRGLDGRGRTIVVVDSFGSPTIRRDLRTFDRAFHLPDPSLTILQPAGAVPPFNSHNSDMLGWAGESSLDVEYAHAMAPAANIVLVETPVDETEGITGFPQIVAAENAVIDRGLGDVISQSFDATEETFPTPQAIFLLRSAVLGAAAHGVTMLAASGDTGAAGFKLDARSFYPFPVVSWPSSDPLVTSVGGTRLSLDARGRRLRADQVWNESSLQAGPAASGGGRSAVFARPAFQNRVHRVVGHARGTPDVSLSAALAGAALIYTSFPGSGGAGWYPVSGTSEATPLFAGVVAIADQAARRRLGAINGLLYALAARHAPGIVDVTAGNNTVRVISHHHVVVVRGYRAAPGYDMASGLGTVDATRLVAELAAG